MAAPRTLAKGREFDTAYQEGAAAGGPFFVVRARANGLGHVRWGFAVGKRLDRRAVVRNRVRRRLKAAGARLEVAGGWEVIVTARAPVLGATFPAIEVALRAQLARLGIAVGDS